MTDHRLNAADLRVRRLVADDWAQLRAARLAALAEAPYAFSSTLAREQAFDEDLWRSRAGACRTFGAFDGAAIVGLATGFPIDSESADSHNGAGPAGDSQPGWHLVGMWVAPGCRGQGVADQLVEAVCDLARQAGADCHALGDRGERPGEGLLPAARLRADRCAPAGPARGAGPLGRGAGAPTALAGGGRASRPWLS